MKITANRESVLRSLDIVSKALESRAIIPAYNNILFDVVGGRCNVYARSNAIQIKSSFPVESKEDFQFCIPGVKITETVRLVSSEMVAFTNKVNDNGTIVTTLTAVGTRNRYKNTGIKPSEFPLMNVGELTDDVKIHMESFQSALGKAVIPVQSNNLSQVITGVNLAGSDNGLLIYGANGNYMYRREMEVDKKINGSMIVPRSMCISIINIPISPDISIQTDGKHIVAKTSISEITGILIEGKFPEVQNFFNMAGEKHIKVNREALMNSMKILKLYSTKESKDMTITVEEDYITLKGENFDGSSEAEECIDIENVGVENGFKIKLNPTFVYTIINSTLTDTITLSMEKHSDPVFFNSKDKEGSWLLAPIYMKE